MFSMSPWLGTNRFSFPVRAQLDQMDPSSKRTAKIEQFKASKALSSQLAELEERRARASKHQDQVWIC